MTKVPNYNVYFPTRINLVSKPKAFDETHGEKMFRFNVNRFGPSQHLNTLKAYNNIADKPKLERPTLSDKPIKKWARYRRMAHSKNLAFAYQKNVSNRTGNFSTINNIKFDDEE
jgi:hypothetical protein